MEVSARNIATEVHYEWNIKCGCDIIAVIKNRSGVARCGFPNPVFCGKLFVVNQVQVVARASTHSKWFLRFLDKFKKVVEECIFS
jgi:hypothetical protein